MKVLRLILGDQLSHSISSLNGCDIDKDIILMCEVWDETSYVKHHKKKIAFLFSAMRHFSEELIDKGYHVSYTQLDDKQNAGSFTAEVKKAIQQYTTDKIVVTHPGEYRVLETMKEWQNNLGIPVEIRDDDRFLCSLKDFDNWCKNRKQLRMEYFYRDMRKKLSILMNGNQPIGGQWNYDSQNRKSPDKNMSVPKQYYNKPDTITKEVITLVQQHFSSHFGDLEPFHFAVTRKQALKALENFIEERLNKFGDYQDSMLESEAWMYHSHISFYLNCGLLLPLECVNAAEKAYHQSKAPLNAVEGFIRQIIGWREFVRGIYWTKMPEYYEKNFFNAKRKLPNFYWTGETKMNCLRQCIVDTQKNAYAHHIQRLMVLGNFALLIGADPKQVNEWFLIVYADAYEWVELPNVSGMTLFADGGYLASKPYAAGGSYINKMSDYCQNCHYKVKNKTGTDACPFNYLYWDFLDRNRNKLENNRRISMIYNTYDRMNTDKKNAVKADSKLFLATLE